MLTSIATITVVIVTIKFTTNKMHAEQVEFARFQAFSSLSSYNKHNYF